MYFNRFVKDDSYVTGNAFLTLEETIAEAIACNLDNEHPMYQWKIETLMCLSDL